MSGSEEWLRVASWVVGPLILGVGWLVRWVLTTSKRRVEQAKLRAESVSLASDEQRSLRSDIDSLYDQLQKARDEVLAKQLVEIDLRTELAELRRELEEVRNELAALRTQMGPRGGE